MRFLIFLFLFLFFSPGILLARTYNLEIKKQNVFITGKAALATTINNSIPGPTLYFKEGEEAEIHVRNSLDETTSIHWHGILLPGYMDGVPGLNGFHGIAPHSTFTYRFKIRQAGTYWYHSHSNLQEQEGLYGAMVIEPKNSNFSGREYAKREYVVVLSDFTEENPATILNNLKIDPGYYNYGKRTISTFFSDVKKNGFSVTLRDYLDWGEMRMDPTDLADVTKYYFLINGKNPEQNWTAIFKKGEKIKLRFINASAMTIFDISIPGLKMKFVEADGQPIKPVIADEFRIGVAETYDVIVEPKEEKVYTIFAESLDRSGYARGTIAPEMGIQGEIPKMRPRTILTMADMPHGEHMNHEDMDIRSGWENRGTAPGKKALSYSDLVSPYPQNDLRKPIREIEFKFGGTMNRYIWTINGEKFPKPIRLRKNERVRLKFVNETMMAHPIHLHGMFMELENGQNAKYLPNKHTVLVPPAQTASMLLTASEEGEWAFHCHLLYHMATGMMTSVKIEK